MVLELCRFNFARVLLYNFIKMKSLLPICVLSDGFADRGFNESFEK